MKMNQKPLFAFNGLLIITAILFTLHTSEILSQQIEFENDEVNLDVSYFYDSAHHWYDIREEQRMIDPAKDQKRYNETEYEKIACNILLFQKNNGGWAKNYDMLAVLTEEQIRSVESSRHSINTTFDNGTTYSQTDYLAKVYAITGKQKYLDGFAKGINFILKAQYPNGGWPQYFPDTSGYRKYITFNDGAMTGIMIVLKKIVDKVTYYNFLDDALYTKVVESYKRGINCILNCQINHNGILTAWCQQHDQVDLSPRPARTFEPAAICNGESTSIVSLLMSVKNPDERIINSVQHAVKWFKESAIKGIKVIVVPADSTDFLYHTSSDDRVVVEDSLAPQIWTRFYKLDTLQPMFCTRAGRIVYSLSEVERERRTGYAWYIYDPQQIINLYPEWQRKWCPENNVLDD